MLLDHFHPPLSNRRDWHGFHTQWAGVLASDLNARLPEGWSAQPEVIFGIEIDVGVIEEEAAIKGFAESSRWEPPRPALTAHFEIDEDAVEIQVLNTGYGPSLMAAIELISPSNKDRPESREAFVSKCISILNKGAGLLIVDLVTSRRANLHIELLNRLNIPVERSGDSLYAAAYQVANREEGEPQIKVWEEVLQLDAPLPTLPLCLRIGPTLPVDLQQTYLDTCRQLKIPSPVAVIA